MGLDTKAIDAMAAGPELDELLAIHVFRRTERLPRAPRGAGRKPGEGVYYSDPCYSTHAPDALGLLEHYAAKGVGYEVHHDPSSKYPHMALFSTPAITMIPEWGMGATFALAVCRGALIFEMLMAEVKR